MRRLATVGTMVALIFIVLFGTASISEAGENRFTYEVTIRNLTSGQAFTPPVVAIHNKRADFYSVGKPASESIQEIAENGNLTPLIDALSADPNVHELFVADAPLVPAGTPGAANFSDSVTFNISGSQQTRHLSVASMLICTNDGFTGLDRVNLPRGINQSVTYTGVGYDAGTEINTEDFADLVPPCQGLIGVSSDDAGTGMSNPDLAEGGVIALHPNIQGGDDLQTAVHGWDDPVIEVTITRVAPVSRYEVTIENLSSGQAFTPPVLVTHNQRTSIYNVGDAASEGIQQIAENGNLAPLLEALANDPLVFDVVAAGAPLVPAGTPGAASFSDSVTLTIESTRWFRRLSFASMLICTNDGFTGLNSVGLPKDVGQTRTLYGIGYDAGTEINTEDFADLVPPCQGLIGVSSGDAGTGMTNPALAEGGVIAIHPNIQGGDDLQTAVHGWDEPVVKVTITRLD